jgi:hypothetical protein
MGTSTEPSHWTIMASGIVFLVTAAACALTYRDPKRNCVTRYLEAYHRLWPSVGPAEGRTYILLSAILFTVVGCLFLWLGVERWK